jgi:hypothetical protein
VTTGLWLEGAGRVPYDSIDEKIAEEEDGRFTWSGDGGETVIPPGVMPVKDGEDCSCKGIGEDLDMCSCDEFGIDFTPVDSLGSQTIFDVVFILL